MSAEVVKRALDMFKQIQAEFPDLLMKSDPPDTSVELSVTIPKQPGLAFEINLKLQNDDELHLCAGAFWCSWFPSPKSDVVQKYHDAVVGLLVGQNRIVEYIRREKAVGADLQAPHENGWKTIARSRCGLLPMSWFSEKHVLSNK